MKIKQIIKNNYFMNKLVEPIYIILFNLPNKIKLGFRKHPSMLAGELKLFESIFHQCRSVVDVGARYDIDYIKISKGHGIKYVLFEANPKYSVKLSRKLSKFSEDYRIENVACGEREGFCDYYKDAESVLKNTTPIKNSTKKLEHKIRMIRLDNYFEAQNLREVDFLKTDIEEYDFFALLGLGKYLKTIKYIQVELGIGAPYKGEFVTNVNYYELLDNDFDLYVIRDENNPLWKNKLVTSDLIRLDDQLKLLIVNYQKTGVGFNLFGVNKFIKNDISKLTVSYL